MLANELELADTSRVAQLSMKGKELGQSCDPVWGADYSKDTLDESAFTLSCWTNATYQRLGQIEFYFSLN